LFRKPRPDSQAFKIGVAVKPNSTKDEIRKLEDGIYVARVRAEPREGKANEALVAALAEYFSVPSSAVKILHGETGRRKLVQIG
jgi:uncharacterized protein (TIGR00251 family)